MAKVSETLYEQVSKRNHLKAKSGHLLLVYNGMHTHMHTCILLPKEHFPDETGLYPVTSTSVKFYHGLTQLRCHNRGGSCYTSADSKMLTLKVF